MSWEHTNHIHRSKAIHPLRALTQLLPSNTHKLNKLCIHNNTDRNHLLHFLLSTPSKTIIRALLLRYHLKCSHQPTTGTGQAEALLPLLPITVSVHLHQELMVQAEARQCQDLLHLQLHLPAQIQHSGRCSKL